jgi:hypothetical protein
MPRSFSTGSSVPASSKDTWRMAIAFCIAPSRFDFSRHLEMDGGASFDS